MLTENDIEKFYQDYKKLRLKKPVSTIAKATGYGSPNVSEWLNKKKVPSEAFINAFYREFCKPSTEEVQDPPAEYKTRHDQLLYNLSESIKAHAEATLLREQNYKEMLKRSTESGAEENQKVFESILPGLRELIIDLGTGTHWKSRDEGAKAVRNKLYGGLPKKNVDGIQKR